MKVLRFIFAISIYAGWYGCVYCGRKNLGWQSLAFPIFSWVLLFQTLKPSVQDLKKIFIFLILGVLFDFASVHLGLITIADQEKGIGLPVWLLSMWFVFAASLPLLKTLFQKRYFLSALMGALFGPLSYYAGSKFEILFFNNQFTVAIYSVFWAVYLACAMYWLEPKKEAGSNAEKAN